MTATSVSVSADPSDAPRFFCPRQITRETSQTAMPARRHRPARARARRGQPTRRMDSRKNVEMESTSGLEFMASIPFALIGRVELDEDSHDVPEEQSDGGEKTE